MAIRLGIDLGGTKIELAALAADGAVALRKRVPSPAWDYTALCAAIAKLVRDADTELGEQGTVGIATPGATSRVTGRIKNSNSLALNDKPLKEDLERAIGRPLRLANDANCFALSEARDGAGEGARVVFGVIAGTGVGGGIVVDGRVLTGPNAIAGEWGHNPLPAPCETDLPAPLCYCGRPGCIEAYLSGPALAADHERLTGEKKDAATIVDAAASGDAKAEATLTRHEERFARALGSVITLLDPDVIVLGGGLSKIARLYENIPKRWTPYVFSDDVRTRLLPPVHGDASGVRGAAWLWEA